MPIINCIGYISVQEAIFEYSGCGAFAPRQNLIQLIGSNKRIFENITEQIPHRSPKRDQIITFIKARASKTINHMQVLNVSR